MPIERNDVAGWILRCRPDVWDLEQVRAQGPQPVPFGIQPTYRAGLIEVGDPVFLWVAGAAAHRGLTAVGEVTSAPSERVEPDLWLDARRRDADQPYLDVQLRFFEAPIRPTVLREVWDLRDMELLRVPRALNPSIVKIRELRALQRLISHIATDDLGDNAAENTAAVG